jgi:hypothetical protein
MKPPIPTDRKVQTQARPQSCPPAVTSLFRTLFTFARGRRGSIGCSTSNLSLGAKLNRAAKPQPEIRQGGNKQLCVLVLVFRHTGCLSRTPIRDWYPSPAFVTSKRHRNQCPVPPAEPGSACAGMTDSTPVTPVIKFAQGAKNLKHKQCKTSLLFVGR